MKPHHLMGNRPKLIPVVNFFPRDDASTRWWSELSSSSSSSGFLNPIHGTLINLTTLPTQNLDPWTGIGPSSCLNNESAGLRRDATATQCDLPRRGTIPSFWSLVAMSVYVVCAGSILHETTAGLWFAPPMQARRGWGVWELNLDWVGHEVQWTGSVGTTFVDRWGEGCSRYDAPQKNNSNRDHN